MPGLVRKATQSLRGALQFARVLDQDDALVEHRRFRPVAHWPAWSCPNDVPPATRMLLAFAHGLAQRIGLDRHHDPVGDIIGERVDAAGGLADGEARCDGHRRQHALEALARHASRGRQFGADDGIVRMGFQPHMWTGDQTDDALGLGWRQMRSPSRTAAFAQTVDPESAVGIDHHLDDQRIGQRLARSSAPWPCAAWCCGAPGFRDVRASRSFGGHSLGSSGWSVCTARAATSSAMRRSPAMRRLTCSMKCWKRSRRDRLCGRLFGSAEVAG